MFLWLLRAIISNQFEDLDLPWESDIPPEELFDGPNIFLWVFAWIFLSIGLVAITVLIIHNKYGREFSLKLSIISLAIVSISLGFAFHFFLLHFGL